MSTRILIAIETETEVRSIYCHFDGYSSGVGQTLLDHYTGDPAKVAALIEEGSRSSLSEEVDDGHSYRAQGDRDEDFINPMSHTDREEWLRIGLEGIGPEWGYLLTHQGWLCVKFGRVERHWNDPSVKRNEHGVVVNFDDIPFTVIRENGSLRPLAEAVAADIAEGSD